MVEQALVLTHRGPVQLVQVLAVLTLVVVELEAHTLSVQVVLVAVRLALLTNPLTMPLSIPVVEVVDSIHQAVATLVVATVDLEL
jgi:hypothetical protein